MTGQLTNTSTVTIQGNAFSVGGSTLTVGGGRVGIGTSNPADALHVSSGGLYMDGTNTNLWVLGQTGAPGDVPVNNNVFMWVPSSGAFRPDGSLERETGTASISAAFRRLRQNTVARGEASGSLSGKGNNALGAQAVVAGGNANQANGNYNAVGGGLDNVTARRTTASRRRQQ